jgi:hypothetical protein
MTLFFLLEGFGGHSTAAAKPRIAAQRLASAGVLFLVRSAKGLCWRPVSTMGRALQPAAGILNFLSQAQFEPTWQSQNQKVETMSIFLEMPAGSVSQEIRKNILLFSVQNMTHKKQNT